MSLLNKAVNDILKISTNKKEFGQDIKLTSLENDVSECVGIATKHSNTIDKDSGFTVKGKNATCSIHELEILRANPDYPIRNSSGEVNMNGHLVDTKDVTGILKNYVILQCMPDETTGLINFVLGDYTND